MKFRTKPIIVDAYQWLNVQPFVYGVKRDVDYFRRPDVSGETICTSCHTKMHDHGFMDKQDKVVCPGDWIVTEPNGERYPVEPLEFELIYEKVP